MYAIIATGGKQYKVEAGRYVDIELIDGDANDAVKFDKVLLVADGDTVKVVNNGKEAIQ